ncbi:AbrB/MazE/SpoVT family DNA-binding domain-containing protein [Cyanobium sp. ATX 6A2]|uniref:AbrB/MazE/SpoVT family DNA-binding domain-containing protein n=1 Tax=Cyanobium sp. ATX 6A2 TaxID=2823700 RepID=UPI0020CEB588|nr:AbrB/MazE/SpoVT family DNA-binding domain-containing protein [Cyanobium sp. ATX 6A2]MCP9888678.1 AbrB/MazE/SpoVT family DNA-binding domain-containing protein [Cyanobium sp. ATX 6A2]
MPSSAGRRSAGPKARSLTVTSKGQLTLRKELLAHLGVQTGQRIDVEVLPGGRLELHAEQATGTIDGFISLLAGRSSHRATLAELDEAAAAGWAGFPTPDAGQP